MGFDKSSARLLLYAKRHGASFDEVVTIGRQKLYLDKALLRKIAGEFSLKLSDEVINEILNKDDGYAESLLKFFGAKTTDSLDFSDYEKATIIQDMNSPVPVTLEKKYSLVIDGGSLEHVFNFPVAIKNCMSMVKVGGHYIGITPVNNLMGHGFYQFSPELFYRILSKENGFKLEKMLIFELKKAPVFYEVIDPDSIGNRVMLINNNYTYLFFLAKRISDAPIFAQTPQQSDYVSMWKGSGPKKGKYKITPYLPGGLVEMLRPVVKKIIDRPKRGFRPAFYKKTDLLSD